jgi:hypothetical protein
MPHEKMIRGLIERKMLRREGDKLIVTEAGEKWTDEMIASYSDMTKAKPTTT